MEGMKKPKENRQIIEFNLDKNEMFMRKNKLGFSLINPIVVGGRGHYLFITGGI